MPSAETGTPYPDRGTGSIDAWSEGVYGALRTWHYAREGKWARWPAGYLLLTIERVNGEAVEPIVLHTADEELTISFGGWVTHNPAPFELWSSGPDVIAEHGRTLVERWLNDKVRTAYFTGGRSMVRLYAGGAERTDAAVGSGRAGTSGFRSDACRGANREAEWLAQLPRSTQLVRIPVESEERQLTVSEQIAFR